MIKIQKVILICACGNTFERYPSQVNGDGKYFCSRACAYKNMPPCSDQRKLNLSIVMSGDGNPAYGGHQWNNDRKKHHSKMMKKAMKDPIRRMSAGNANRDKKFTLERRANMAAAHVGITGHSPSKRRRREIGKEASIRWQDPVYKRNIIEKGTRTKELQGKIVPRSKLPEWKFYWREANWISGFKYTNKKNLREKGLCRDHIVGRKQGFDLRIYPEIIRHPANCKIILWADNTKKARRTPDETQVPLLFERILTYSGNYPEHHHAVDLVKKYISGERWVKE